MAYRNLLLIDDDEDDHEIFVSAANAASGDVACTTLFNGKDALKRLSQKEITPDVIFLDLNMPVMSGRQFLIEIKKIEELRNIPVIIYSTSSHPQTIQSIKELGASDFITKPALYDELVTILKPLLT